jgi:DNA (cytosine-5)-methyltransferase 1
VNTDKYEYILTYSFPCQDLSLAGNRKGMKKGGSTRSGLLWEVERILNELKDNNLELPQILLMENVPQIASSTHSKDFGDWQHALQKLGYKSYCNNLIATDFGIPQTRDRTFMISILGDYFYRFPQPIKLTTRLSDYLESEVDEKYFLSDKMVKFFEENSKANEIKGNGFRFKPHDENSKYSYTITTRAGGRMDDNFILVPEKTKKGYAVAEDGDGIYINRPHQKRGVVQKGAIQTIKTQPNDIGVVAKDNNIYNSLSTIFNLCCIIDTKEKDKYERSRELLQILWEEIGKKEIWQEIRRFISIQEKKILQSNLYENELYKDRKPQSKISTSTPNSSEYNESITNREKMFDMWKNWKTRYTPQRWELSEQQFRQFNLFMQELSYETTQGETSMQDMWQTNERFRILQQTLFKIQEIWRPNENKISNGLRIRKLTPREVFRLMGVKDRDYDKIADFSNSSLYKLAGNSIVIQVLMGIFGELLGIDYKKKIKESVN